MLRGIIAIIAGASFSVLGSAQQLKPAPKYASKGLPIGVTFEGELKTEVYGVFGDIKGKSVALTYNTVSYRTDLPISLKAGQSIDFSATVTGKDRKINLTLLDPTGQPVGGKYESNKSVTLSIEEVSATGIYTIVVFSDKIGPFSIRATNSSEDDDEKTLVEKLRQSEKHTEELKEKLKALREKKR